MPDSYKKLVEHDNCLPCGESFAEYSFGGIIFDLNVATKNHKDTENLDLCLIIIISKCMGGDIVLLDPGLTL